MTDDLPYAHAGELDDEEKARCVDCGAVHAVGPDLDPGERGCMCGGDLLLVERVDVDSIPIDLPYDDAPAYVAAASSGSVEEEAFLTVFGKEAARDLTQTDRLQWSPVEGLFYVEGEA